MAKRSNGAANGRSEKPRRRGRLEQWLAEPLSTRETDSEEFRERVQDEARRHLGGTIEELTSDPDLREILYSVIATGLRSELPPISPEMRETVERLRAAGIPATPGAGPQYLRKPVNLGVSLSDAILEERYGIG